MRAMASGGGLARAIFALIVLSIMLVAGAATIFLMLHLLGFVGN